MLGITVKIVKAIWDRKLSFSNIHLFPKCGRNHMLKTFQNFKTLTVNTHWAFIICFTYLEKLWSLPLAARVGREQTHAQQAKGVPALDLLESTKHRRLTWSLAPTGEREGQTEAQIPGRGGGRRMAGSRCAARLTAGPGSGAERPSSGNCGLFPGEFIHFTRTC